MTCEELLQKLHGIDLQLPIVLEQRVKTGYDEGEIYHSVDIDVAVFKGRVTLTAKGCKLVGGW